MKKTPLTRKAMKKKPRRTGRDPAACDKYAQEHLECLVCERSLFDFGVIGELHHLLGGMRGLRKDAPWNFAMLCRDCHHQYHERFGLSRAEIMYLKRIRDPAAWDWHELARLYRGEGRAILESPRKPEWYGGKIPWLH